MGTKVETVIVNGTNQGLTVKVGNRNCYARLASVKIGGRYTMQIDVNWTYREFLLQPTDKLNDSSGENQLFISSDDCCDYERITIKENTDGSLDAHRELREHFRIAIQIESDGPDEEKFVKTRGWRMWLHKFT